MPYRSILWFVILLAAFSSLACAQDNIQQNENLPRLPPQLRESPNQSDIFVNPNDQAQKQQAAYAEAMRREAIKRDSAKLFELTAQLKGQLDKDGGDVLSADAARMVQQIEKLAHGLKQKMKE